MKTFHKLEYFRNRAGRFLGRILPSAIVLLGVSEAGAVESPSDLRALVLQSPAVQAARLRWEAARQREPAAGRLPDPQLEGMYTRVSDPEDDWPMWEVTLQQPLPQAGMRAAERAQAVAEARMAEADYAMAAGEAAADTAMQLAELATMQERIGLLELQLTRIERSRSALDTRIATGKGASAERLALEARAADLQLMLAQDRQRASNATTSARARLGISPHEPLPDFDAPQPGDVDVDQSPAGQQSAARRQDADARAAMARAGGRPMTAVGVRFGREQMREGDEDTMGIAFMTDLPWRSRRASRADLAAAHSESAAGQSDAERARRNAQAAVDACERAAEVAKLAAELGEHTGRRLDAEYDALVRSSGTGGMGSSSVLLMLLEILDRQIDVQMKVIEAQGALRAARARLWEFILPSLLLHDGGT